MTQPLVSIVIPVYDKQDFVLESLRSITLQTYTHWECILVDDGSHDASVELIEKYVATHPGNWRLVKQKNSGPSSARNTGINLAKGEFIAFLDADDIWTPEKLQDQIAYMKSNPNTSLLLSYFVIFQKNPILKLRVVTHRNSKKMISEWLKMTGFGGLVESTGLLRKKDLLNSLLFDETLRTSEGLDFVIRWSYSHEIAICKNIHTLYRLSDNQLHKDEVMIKNSVSSLVSRHIMDRKEREKVTSLHDSFFFWAELRNADKDRLVKSTLRTILSMDKPNLEMLFAISKRNFVAKWKALFIKRKIRKYLNVLNAT